jgi:hypothetical protein
MCKTSRTAFQAEGIGSEKALEKKQAQSVSVKRWMWLHLGGQGFKG